MFRLRAKRTLGSNPPADLLFGELAYSDANKRLYIGRADGSPCTFESDLSLSPITDGLAAIEAEQGTQNDAIAALITATNDQSSAINALDAIQTAQAAALAETETTAELNARDAANRARGNHTGTQEVSTITGLAPVASSGSYNDITDKPTIPAGFTYDQQAEPSAPTAGATWRERSTGGLIVGEWEWSGSLWLSSLRFCLLYSGLAASASTANVLSTYPQYPILLVGYSASFNTPNAPQDSSNHWLFRHNQVTTGDTLSTAGQSTTTSTALRLILTTPVVISSPAAAANQLFKVNSPGNLNQYAVTSFYKLIRS